MKKPFLLVFCLVIALLACVANLNLDEYSSFAIGDTTSLPSIVDDVRQSEATPASTTVTSTTRAPTTTTLSTTRAPVELKAATETFVSESVNYGTNGRLYVPRVGISVALYYYEITPENFQVAQAVTDRTDSATCGYDYGVFIISDHRTQEFGSLLNVTVGDTAHIDYPDGTRVNMVCVNVANGYNDSWDLWDNDGGLATDPSRCDVLMRTCINSNGGIRLTYWCYY
ncbi:hypothetical protein IJ102_01830 [Candidatus Saccharibacteria bacterium]|nr:hypothetical protein [Candidatus Saccharibacteria bacterium]